jgi:hypothetical protein
MTTQFWSNDLTALLNKDSIFELWPASNMSIEQKLNAITRLIIVLTILGFIFTQNLNILFVGVITIAVIYLLYNSKKQKISKDILNNLEGFSANNSEISIQNPETLDYYLKSDFESVSKKNPMGNVLLTDIGSNPDRKAAPPSFNPSVSEEINKSAKKMIQSLNPGIKNTNKQLFGDLGEEFEFEQSMWNYYSNPNTKVANDQGAFAKFLYGDMPSCKDGDSYECVKDNPRYNLY